MNLEQLPKFEAFDNHLFFNTKMLQYNDPTDHILEEHLCLVMSKNLIITFQEGLPGDSFDPIRTRIFLGTGLIRKHGSDYLFYHLINSVLANYLEIMEQLRERIERLEESALADSSLNVVNTVIKLKKEINTLRRYTLPMREAFLNMRVEGARFIPKTSIIYFQDVADHLQYLVVSFETAREMLKDLMDLHRANQNTEMNRVMKTLTVISAIFIPLTFLAGVYGMNFSHLPGLTTSYGYLIIIGVILTIAMAMAIYMKFKKWF